MEANERRRTEVETRMKENLLLEQQWFLFFQRVEFLLKHMCVCNSISKWSFSVFQSLQSQPYQSTIISIQYYYAFNGGFAVFVFLFCFFMYFHCIAIWFFARVFRFWLGYMQFFFSSDFICTKCNFFYAPLLWYCF